MLERIAAGRTDLVFDWIERGHPVDATVAGGGLLTWCAYYGDVSAIRFLLGNGAALVELGEGLGLNGAAFHGHWRLCEFLLDRAPIPIGRWKILAKCRFMPRSTGSRAWSMNRSSGCCSLGAPIPIA